jgi:translation initiation factor IF-2
LARIYRGKELLAEDIEVTNLKRGPQDVKEVLEGDMCGLSLKTDKRVDIAEEDRVEFYTRSTKTRTL